MIYRDHSLACPRCNLDLARGTASEAWTCGRCRGALLGVGELGTLRRWRVYYAFRRALATSLAHVDFRVVHLSIQRTHVHLIAEAADHDALARGMQGLLISAARRINRAFVGLREVPGPAVRF